jgi:hypothetical protein
MIDGHRPLKVNSNRKEYRNRWLFYDVGSHRQARHKRRLNAVSDPDAMKSPYSRALQR